MKTQYDISRYNMVNYIKTWEVDDNTILDIMGSISRESFFPDNLSSLSYADAMVPIGHGQVSLEPKVIARILQSLNVKKSHTVLEIGTGSGYLTTILSKLAKEVHTIELIPEISNNAKFIFDKLNIKNISSEIGNGLDNLDKLNSFDLIVVTGSLNKVPQNLIKKLNKKGKLFLTVGTKPIMRATMFTKTDNGILEEILFDTSIPEIVDNRDCKNIQY